MGAGKKISIIIIQQFHLPHKKKTEMTQRCISVFLLNLNFHVRETGADDRLYAHVSMFGRHVRGTDVNDRIYAPVRTIQGSQSEPLRRVRVACKATSSFPHACSS